MSAITLIISNVFYVLIDTQENNDLRAHINYQHYLDHKSIAVGHQKVR